MLIKKTLKLEHKLILNPFFMFLYPCLQGLVPVKWMAIESLADRVYSEQSDV